MCAIIRDSPDMLARRLALQVLVSVVCAGVVLRNSLIRVFPQLRVSPRMASVGRRFLAADKPKVQPVQLYDTPNQKKPYTPHRIADPVLDHTQRLAEQRSPSIMG